MTISTIIARAISAVLGVSLPCWPQLPLAVGLVTATALSNCRRDIGPFLCLGNPPSCNDCLRQSHAFQIEGSGAWWRLGTARPKCQELHGMGGSSFRGSWNVGSVKKGTESNWLSLNRGFACQNLENVFSECKRRRIRKSTWSGVRRSWIQTPAFPLTNSVTLGKPLNPFKPAFSPL